MPSNRNTEILKMSEKFQHFLSLLRQGHQYIAGRRDIGLIITGDNQNPILPEDIAKYLEDFEGFHIMDFRNKGTEEIEKYAGDFRTHSRMCMILPASFHPTLSQMFYWIYERNEINLSSGAPYHKAFKLRDDSILVGIMNTEDYASIELNTGWDSQKFYRMVAPCFRFE